MSRYYEGWAPYVPVVERRRQAERDMAKLRKSGYPVALVTIAGRVIASTLWGRAWCDNLESYHDYETRLPRGRSYVRNGSVVDLQVAPGLIAARVAGSELYTVSVKAAAKAQWRAICADCAGGIASLVELLQGRLSKAVIERLCRQDGGLFPRPSDIRFRCSCPDHAAMCKHVAAVLYGVGARLDDKPDLLFRLRAVDETDLIAGIDAARPLSASGPAASRVLETDDMAALFGLDMATVQAPPSAAEPSGKAKAVKRVAGTKPKGPASLKPATAVRPATAAKKPVSASGRASKPQVVAVAVAASARKPATRSPSPTDAPGPIQATQASDPLPAPARERRRSLDVATKGSSTRMPRPKPVKWW